MAGQRILVTLPLQGDEPQRFQAAFPTAEFAFREVGQETQDDIASATAIIGRVPADCIKASQLLGWLHLPTAGADRFVKPGVLASTTTLTCSVGAYGQAVSEHSFASLLALIKKLHLYRDNQRQSLWHDEGPVTTLRGSRVAVVGAGDLGTHFARLCTLMGANCTAVVHRLPASLAPEFREAFQDARPVSELTDVLHQSDVVACFLPSTQETRGLADASFFRAMPRGSYFVNAGRGDLVDQDALCDALESGHLAGAAIDVASPEPLPADSRLWRQKNALVTPHVAGFWHLSVTRDNVVRISLENLRRYCRGEELRNVVPH